MVLHLTLSITLLMLGLPDEATLKAETPAQACKSTVTGTLEMIPLELSWYWPVLSGVMPVADRFTEVERERSIAVEPTTYESTLGNRIFAEPIRLPF
jgi:hypothetical protein